MMQIRMIASLSSAHRFGIRDRGYLELAGRGYDFLINRMWDEAEGGFYYSVTREGEPNTTRKNTDFHSYVITGLVEYYLASGRAEALEWAERVFELLVDRASDRDLGFVEDFDGGEWDVLNDEQMNLGKRKRIKTVDMHTNVMESLVYLSRVTANPRHLKVLRQTVDLIRERGIHPEYGCSITAFDYDWNPVTDVHGRMTTSYCLNAEIAWLMLEAVDLLQESREKYRSTILGLIDHGLDFGFDHVRGGLAAYGPMTGRVTDAVDLVASRLYKPWWGQAEMLNALIDAYRWTKEQRYLNAFVQLFDWVWTFQIDHECGGWYQDVQWKSGEPVTTDKGREWKTSFHSGRALIRISTALRKMV
jgi:mannobiose 2-epimerase